jgi:hypothetical protein
MQGSSAYEIHAYDFSLIEIVDSLNTSFILQH